MSRLIVKSLPKNTTEDKIRKLFSEKGEITDVQLKYTPDGKFRQFCFIGYRTPEQADEALNYFNNSCINTTRIYVEKCANLGDSNKPKSWSKYASDSSAFKKLHPEDTKAAEERNNEPKVQKKSRIQELLEKHKDDPMFEEFMQLNGIKDTTGLIEKLTATSNKIEGKIEDNNDKEDSGNESSENVEKTANKDISDLEYMKFLMKKSERKKRTEKQPKEKIKLYTVKLRGLAYATKKRDIKQFLNPLVPYTIRIPQKIKGIAYIGFKQEKQMKQALNKNRSFIGGKQIAVYEYTNNEEKSEEDPKNAKKNKWISQEEALKNEEDISESGRIFVRNLSYTTTEDDIQQLFSKYGPITEVNLPLDKNTRKLKGFGVVTFLMPEHAVQAYSQLDGSVLHGRMLHLLPGKTKDNEEDDNTEGLNYKQKKALKDKAQAGSSHNWNTLFMGHNAVADIIADTYATTKEAVLDWQGKGSAAVRLALGETQIVTSTKEFLEENGISLDAFNQPASQRSKTVILAKNLPALTKPRELQELFSPYGLIGRIVLPPSGVTAVIEFFEPSEARKAFTKLAYSKFKNTPLYLEWAPDNTFKTAISKDNKIKSNKTTDENKESSKSEDQPAVLENKVDVIDEDKEKDDDDDEDEEPPENDTTLFIKNLNFSTTEDVLRKHFEPMGKINYVMIATKKDPKNPENKLSMGYGFVRFQHKSSTEKALKNLQQSLLEGKSVELKRSERTLQSEVESTRKKIKHTKQTGSKILVRNIPFQANKNEVMELFQAFGEIKALRLPKKMTGGVDSHRGFAFVDYVSKSDAKKAFKSLSQSTHLYGRRLVLEWAALEEGVEDIRKRTAKHFHPTEEVKSKKSVFSLDE